MLHSARSQVTENTIANWFWKSGFVKKNEKTETQEKDKAVYPPPEEYVAMDEEVEVFGELLNRNILVEVLKKKKENLSDVDEA